jgi:hypothetical protein
MMLLSPTNLEEKLSLVQKKSSVNILDEVKEIIYEDHLKEQRIVSSLKRGSNLLQNNFKFDELETENIYHINSIKKICVDSPPVGSNCVIFTPSHPFPLLLVSSWRGPCTDRQTVTLKRTS